MLLRPNFFKSLGIAQKAFLSSNVSRVTRLRDQLKLETDPLTDTFGRHHDYLRISLTERCNLRYLRPSSKTHQSLKLPNNLSHLFSTAKTNSLRYYSTSDQLTHVNKEGKASMVDVSAKGSSLRTATARAVVRIGDQITQLIKINGLKKGDVLSIAQIAGIMGAKKTSDIIPLCHNIPLSNIYVNVHLDTNQKTVIISATVKSEGKTGVEMEALTAVSLSALTIYDMCKSVSHDITITDIVLLNKTGGTSGDYESHEVHVKNYEKSPILKGPVVMGHL